MAMADAVSKTALARIQLALPSVSLAVGVSSSSFGPAVSRRQPSPPLTSDRLRVGDDPTNAILGGEVFLLTSSKPAFLPLTAKALQPSFEFPAASGRRLTERKPRWS